MKKLTKNQKEDILATLGMAISVGLLFALHSAGSYSSGWLDGNEEGISLGRIMERHEQLLKEQSIEEEEAE